MAKKNNRFAEEIDLTSFSWITAGSDAQHGKPGCGGCHPGGGGLEYDRDGFRYDQQLREKPELAALPDGDYYRSKWDKTGVVEADCLICHLPGYFFKERVKNLELLNFQWAIVAGSGVGLVNGAVRNDEAPRVVYNKRFFNDDGKIVFNLEARPDSENCLFCHGPADMIKRGFSWNDHGNHDIHNARNIGCTACHPGNIEHQLAKGRENLSTVRDDLDNTMRTCKSCHEVGYMGAPKPVHREVRPNHLEKIACEVCHIPELRRSSASGLDVSNGKVRLLPRPGAGMVGDELAWLPEIRLGPDEKLYPVNSFKPNLFTNKSAGGIYVPLFSKEIAQAYATVGSQFRQEGAAEPLISTKREISAMLGALAASLQNNPRFDRVFPCYHSNGAIFHLDGAGNLISETDDSWTAEPNNFNISHNVSPTHMALGARGCVDCHAERAVIFSSWLAERSDNGAKAFVPYRTGDNESSVYYLNLLHKYNAAKKYLIPLLFSVVFALVLFRESRSRSTTIARSEAPQSGRMFFIVGLLLLVRNISFLLLTCTGIIFLFNKINIIQIFFASPESAAILHWSGGLVFVASIAGCIVIHRRFFVNRKTEICHLGITGGPMLILTMALTGIVMIFRNTLAAEIIYVCSFIHTFAAFVLMAVYSAKIYHEATRRIYHHQQRGQ